MNDADYQEASIRASAESIANKVCPLCEEYLANGAPIADGLPYHEACLREGIR